MLSEDEHLTKANNEITAAQAYVWHVVVAPPCVCVCNSCSICKIAAVFTAIAINLVIIRACVCVCVAIIYLVVRLSGGMFCDTLKML